MNLIDYCDTINVNLEVTRYANQNERWVAAFKYVEVKEGCALASSYGEGKTPQEAIENYIQIIRGKHIVIHATSPSFRREFTVPMRLTL